MAATMLAAPLLAGTTLAQQLGTVGGVTGGGGVPFGMAAARVWRRVINQHEEAAVEGMRIRAELR